MKLIYENLSKSNYKSPNKIGKFCYQVEIEDGELFLGIWNDEKDISFEQTRNEISEILFDFSPISGSNIHWPVWYYPNQQCILNKGQINNITNTQLFELNKNMEEQASIIVNYFVEILDALKARVNNK